jgi:hypothetical protein
MDKLLREVLTELYCIHNLIKQVNLQCLGVLVGLVLKALLSSLSNTAAPPLQ